MIVLDDHGLVVVMVPPVMMVPDDHDWIRIRCKRRGQRHHRKIVMRYVANLVGQSRWDLIALQSVAIAAGIFLLVGLWTPVVGVIVAVLGVGAVISGTPYVRGAILLAVVGAALAMLGPGVTSIDARLFGRKRIDIP